MHDVRRRVGLEGYARELAQLEGDLERRPVRDAARDDGPARDARVDGHVDPARQLALLRDTLRDVFQLPEPSLVVHRRGREQRQSRKGVHVRLRRRDSPLEPGVELDHVLRSPGRRRLRLVREGDRRPSLPAPLLEDGCHVR